MTPVRLQVHLARSGVGSRRACEDLIREGRVRVNGKVVTVLGTKVDPATDRVTVGRRVVRPATTLRHVLLNKPRGVVCTAADPEGRPTVLDLVRGYRELLHPVGRLDLQTTGLLLLTNDGELTEALTHPRSEIPRLYRAKVRGTPDERAVRRLGRGLRLGGRPAAPVEVRVGRTTGNASWIEVIVREGRKHLVRDALAAVGHPVVKLHRVGLGPLRLRNLRLGEHRELTAAEVARLRAAADNARRRGPRRGEKRPGGAPPEGALQGPPAARKARARGRPRGRGRP